MKARRKGKKLKWKLEGNLLVLKKKPQDRQPAHNCQEGRKGEGDGEVKKQKPCYLR